MRRDLTTRAETGLGHFKLLPTHLQYGYVVQRFTVRGVHGDGYFEGLVCQSQVTQGDSHVADVVPVRKNTVDV